MRLGVFGSRTLKGDRVAMLIIDELNKYQGNSDTEDLVIVTTQEPSGVCTVAQQVAKQYHYTLELHFLNFRFCSGAYEHRSKRVIENSDRILIIHDGKSKGTSNELELCKKMGKPYRYELLDIDTAEHRLDYKLDTFSSDKGNSDSDIFSNVF